MKPVRVISGGATLIKAHAKLAESLSVRTLSRLQVEESVLHANKNGYVRVLVANPTNSPKELACGAIIIGQIEAFVKASQKDLMDHTAETVLEWSLAY